MRFLPTIIMKKRVRDNFLGMDKDTQKQKDRERGGLKKRSVAETITIAKSTINSM